MFLRFQMMIISVFPKTLVECAIVYSFTTLCSPIPIAKKTNNNKSSPSKSYFYIVHVFNYYKISIVQFYQIY